MMGTAMVLLLGIDEGTVPLVEGHSAAAVDVGASA